MKTLCSLCSAYVVGRGFCKQHYRAFMKYGDPLHRANLRGVPFHERYTVDLKTQCWLWIGSTDTCGYGIGRFAGEVSAHRASWALTHGPIPPGMHVLHRCDKPACVNPAHLYLGTHQDNMADLRAKGRAYGAAGEANQGAKLTEQQARAIMADPRKRQVIATQYKVTAAAVDAIRNGKTWNHIFDESVRAERIAAGPRRLSAVERAAIAADPRTQVVIAAAYGVSQSLVSAIKRKAKP